MRLEISNDPARYMGIEGMVRLAKPNKTHLLKIYSAFGGDSKLKSIRNRGLKVIEELTGVNIGPSLGGAGDLGWERIEMPYEQLEQLALEISKDPTRDMGSVGMVRLAKRNEKHMGQIFSDIRGHR